MSFLPQLIIKKRFSPENRNLDVILMVRSEALRLKIKLLLHSWYLQQSESVRGNDLKTTM